MIFLITLLLIGAAFVCGVKFHAQITQVMNRFLKKAETLAPVVNGRMIGASKSFADFIRENGSSGSFAEDAKRWENYGGPTKEAYQRYVENLRN